MRYWIMAVAVLSFACGEEAKGGGAPTYHRDIRPLLEQKCVSCHTEGGIGPFSLEDWESVEPVKTLVSAAVEDGTMPPWPASDECREIADTLPLSDAQRELFAEWEQADYPVGKPSDYEAPEEEQDADLGEPDILLEPAKAYTPDTDIDDEYRCFLTDGLIEEDTFITGMDIRPGVLEQVHHVQVHRIDAGLIPEVEALDDEADGTGYPCAGAGVSSVNMFSWRPGSKAVVFAEGDAAFIPGGSAIVLQVHYNNQFLQPGKDPEPDLSSVAFWALPEGELPDRVVARAMHLGPVGMSSFANPLGVIPAGESEVIGESTSPLSSLSTVNGSFVPGEIIGVTPHMHTLGTRLSETFFPADSDEETCLVDVPVWDFEWQLDYAFREPLAFGPDDRVKLVCEYDNSPKNQPYLDGERIQPRDVTWGEGSLDEMCLNYLWFRYDLDDFLEAQQSMGEGPEVDPDCPRYQGELAGMALDLPGCCSADGVCGVISSLSNTCITESSFLEDLEPGPDCGE